MIKEAPVNIINTFNFSPDGPSPFDMIASGAFAFEAPAILEPEKPLIPEPVQLKLTAKLSSPVINAISFEERIARRRNPAMKVDISRRDWLVQEIQNNQTSVVRLAEVAMLAARRDAENCATDGHGNKINNDPLNTKLEIVSSNKSLDPNAKHESGSHGHCEHNEDYGKCSKGCKKAA